MALLALEKPAPPESLAQLVLLALELRVREKPAQPELQEVSVLPVLALRVLEKLAQLASPVLVA